MKRFYKCMIIFILAIYSFAVGSIVEMLSRVVHNAIPESDLPILAHFLTYSLRSSGDVPYHLTYIELFTIFFFIFCIIVLTLNISFKVKVEVFFIFETTVFALVSAIMFGALSLLYIPESLPLKEDASGFELAVHFSFLPLLLISVFLFLRKICCKCRKKRLQ